MNVSPDALRKETVSLLREIDEEVAVYIGAAQRQDLSPFQVSKQGHYGYGELVAAKLLALNTLAVLNESK